jgi:hypothetical protein
MKFILILSLVFYVARARATEFEKLGDSIGKSLGTKQVFQTKATVGSETISLFYSKDGSGKANKFAALQKGIYEPNCTHTWIIGLDKSAKIDSIRVVEMSCPHAFPTREDSYLDQYKGKGPKDLATLKGQIHTVAKATGSCNLTTDAVIKSIKAVASVKGTL